jgi:hypothetical protein
MTYASSAIGSSASGRRIDVARHPDRTSRMWPSITDDEPFLPQLKNSEGDMRYGRPTDFDSAEWRRWPLSASS